MLLFVIIQELTTTAQTTKPLPACCYPESINLVVHADVSERPKASL